jgi:N-methylhydantoinase B
MKIGGVRKMRDDNSFEIITPVADFSILASSFYNISQQMGLTMQRTARSPLFYASRDFICAILTPYGELISMAEYIPVLVGSSPFAVRAVTKYFGDDINEGDVFLLNDPYTYDGGNHLPDWSIVYPVFYNGKLKYMLAEKAHQIDAGGPVPGGYNPNALDIWGEGLRIPPVKIFEGGKERRDVLNLVLTNVRGYETQRGDLLSLIGAARIGERRLAEMLHKYGEETITTFITDLFNYSEYRMRGKISEIPDGDYHGEVTGMEGASPIVVDISVKGSDMIVDLRKSGPQVKEYINSTISNTYSCIMLSLLTSLGKKIERQFRNQGCFRPVEILTKPGTIVHAEDPATIANCTVIIGAQIVDAVWDALSKVVWEEVSAGWGRLNNWAISGIDPRRNERWGTPDLRSATPGSGAIWGVDGWSGASPEHSSGASMIPEIEVCEDRFPIFVNKWELVTDSGGAGRWRGGCGVENIWIADSGSEPVYAASQADPYNYEVTPTIQGGKAPQPSTKKIIFADGSEATNEDIREKKIYVLHSGDMAIDFIQGGGGVGDPFERDVESVIEDVRDELVSIEKAKEEYGVVLDPKTLAIDREETLKLRMKK